MKAYALPASIVFLALALVFGVYFYNSQQAVGSVIYGGEYQARYITSSDANATSSLKKTVGSIGSVVITEVGSGGDIVFYATTTAGQLQATSSNDVLFKVDGAAGEGTYTYDVAFGQTVMIEVESGYNGQATITYR